MPELSIVIAAFHGPYNLDPVLGKCRGIDAEIILVRTDASTLPAPAECVKFIRVKPGSSERQMRSAGRQQARADCVAVLGDRYDLSDTWVRSAISSGTTISGPVLPPLGLSLSAWAIYLAEYPRKAAPAEGNTVYRDARNPLFDPGLSVVFARPPHWKQYLSERYQSSREWAREQCAGTSAMRRYINAASRLALPLLLLRRRAAGPYHWRFLAALPYLLVSGFVETTGEISGFLSGAK